MSQLNGLWLISVSLSHTRRVKFESEVEVSSVNFTLRIAPKHHAQTQGSNLQNILKKNCIKYHTLALFKCIGRMKTNIIFCHSKEHTQLCVCDQSGIQTQDFLVTKPTCYHYTTSP